MTKREPLMSEAYFEGRVFYIQEVIQEVINDLPTCSDKQAACFTLVRRRLALLYTHYSAGYPIGTLQTDLWEILELWEALRATDPQNSYAISFKNDLTDYVEALGMLSIAHLVHSDSAIIVRLLGCIGNEGQDWLFERLIVAVVPSVMRKPAKKLLYPKTYQTLYDALDAPAEEQPQLMTQFLTHWYKGIKSVGWYNAHKGPEGGGFNGYWCWEAAGAAYAVGIDDATFRDLHYYPKDLADYAKANQQPA